MVTRSEAQGELGQALAKAQGAIYSAEKDRRNPHLKNDYATLQSVIKATRKPLADNGLSLTCAPVVEDGKAGVAWTLRHSSGEWEAGVLLMPLGQGRGTTPMQNVGSCASYAHRYVRMHLLACAAGDDVDGNTDERVKAPSNNKRPPVNDNKRTAPTVDTLSPAWLSWRKRLEASTLSLDVLEAWCTAHKRPLPHAMTLAQWRKLCEWLDGDGARIVSTWANDGR